MLPEEEYPKDGYENPRDEANSQDGEISQPGMAGYGNGGGNGGDTALPSPGEEGDERGRLIRISQLEKEEKEHLAEIETKREEKSSTPRFVLDDPKIETKAKLAIGAVSFATCEAMMAGNMSRFAIDFTQSVLGSVAFVGVFPLIAVGLESYAACLSEGGIRLNKAMAWVFTASGLAFLWTFAQEFGYVPEIGDGSGLLGGYDYRPMMVSQCLLEISITFGLLQKARGWLYDLRTPTPNYLWLRLEWDVEELEESLETIRSEKAELVVESAEFQEQKARALAAKERRDRFARLWHESN